MRAFQFLGRLSIALIFCAISVLLAQSDKGTITGSVTDSTGAVVPNVAITVTNTATNLQRKTQTTEAGRFILPEMPAGTYSVSAAFTGFRTHTQTGVSVEVSKTSSLSIVLQVGQAAESIEVVGDASMLNAANADVSTTVKNSYITELPMNFSQNIRNPYGFLKLVPGANVGKDGGWLMTSQNGLQSFSEEIRVDGGSIANPTPGVITEVQPGVDAIEEFTVQTNTYSAEYGSASGSIINFSMKSGTNSLHGTGYGFLRNEALNASNKDTGANPRQRRADWGGTFGGPIVIPKLYNGKDKSFFFATYEKFWSREKSMGYYNVPRDEWRTGNMSSILLPASAGTDAMGRDVMQGQIFDPASLFYVDGANGTRIAMRNPFAGNIIPTSRISAISQKILGFVPKATIPGVDTNNLIGINGDPLRDTSIASLKLDHNFSDRNHLSGSFSKQNVHKLNGTDPFGKASAERDQNINSIIGRINDDHTFSPTMLNHVTLGVMRYVNPDGGTKYADFNSLRDLGLKGSPDPEWFPWISYGMFDLGARSAKIMSHLTFTATDAVTWIKGAHTIKFGGEYRRAMANIWSSGNGQANSWGHLNFASAQTAQPSLAGTNGYGQTGRPFASFLLGLVGSQDLLTPVALGYRYSDTAFFFQDDFKVTSKLTLNLGLRYDLHMPLGEKYGRISSFQPNIPNAKAGGIMGAVGYLTGPNAIQRGSFRDTDFGAIGPRFGFAYQANQKTVLRGGFGVSYGRLELNDFGPIQNIGAASVGFIPAPFDSLTSAMTTLENGILPVNGSLYDPGVANNSGIGYFYPEQKLPRIFNWNITVQRELGPNTSLTAGWVATHGSRLISPAQQFNQNNFSVLSMGNKLSQWIGNASDAAALGVKYPYAGFTGTVAQALRPFPQFGGINGPQATIGTSDYHSLQVQMKHRLSHGFDALVSYTLSKALTDVDDAVAWGGGGTNGVDTNNRALNRGLAVDTFGMGRGDRTHQLSAALSYELPFKEMVENKTAKYLVSGWKVNGILQYQSGEALAISHPNPIGGYVFNGSGRLNIVKGQSLTSKCNNDWPGQCSLLNPAAFSSPAAFTLGDAARTYGAVRGHPWFQEDLSVARNFALAEQKYIQFRAEAINAFNRSVFNNPNTNPLDTIYSQGGRMNGYGTFWGRANTQRQMQLMLKFVF